MTSIKTRKIIAALTATAALASVPAAADAATKTRPTTTTTTTTTTTSGSGYAYFDSAPTDVGGIDGHSTDAQCKKAFGEYNAAVDLAGDATNAGDNEAAERYGDAAANLAAAISANCIVIY